MESALFGMQIKHKLTHVIMVLHSSRPLRPFSTPFCVLSTLARPDEGVRDAVIGMDMHWNLLFVGHIFVENEQLRVISARKATRNEKQIYEN